MPATLVAAYEQYQLHNRSAEFELGFFQSHICSYLTLLPESIVDNHSSLVRERQARVEIMNLLCTREDLLMHFFEAESFDHEDASVMLSHYYDGSTVENTSSPGTTKLETMPQDFIRALADLANNVMSNGHKGLFTEQISMEDFILLLTTGHPFKVYHCETNSHFAFFAYYLAVEKTLLDATSYLHTICSGKMLYSKDRMVRRKLVKGIVLSVNNLASGRTYINEDIQPYATIIEDIDNLCRLYIL